MKLFTFLILILTATGLFIAVPELLAQDKGDDFRNRIEKIKLEKLIKKLELDSSTALSFTEKYKSYSSSVRDINKKRLDAYRKMTQNLESGDGLDVIVDELLELEKELNQKKLEFTSELKIMLTAKQMAKMIIFEKKFQNEIRKLLKEQSKQERKENRKEKNED